MTLSLRQSLLMALGVVTLVAASGCGGPEPTHTRIVDRWLDRDPVEVFNPDAFQDEAVVFRDLLSGGRSARWAERGSASSNTGFAHPLVARLDLDAADLDHVTVAVAHSDPGFLKIKVAWAGPDEKFTSERSLELTAGLNSTPATTKYRFMVSNHRLWKGTIERLRLTAVFPAPLKPVHVIGTRANYRAGALPSMVHESWKIEIGSDLRNSVIGLPGLPRTKRFSIPRQARLRLAYGVLGRSQTGIDFRLGIRADGEEQVLLSDTIEGHELPMTSWKSADLDLAPWAGKDVEIELLTTGRQEPNEVTAIPVWANPEIIAATADPPPMNVVLISVDTLRADRLSLYGYERPTSPNLETWIQDSGVVFDNAVSQASWTLPSHVSMLTGVGAFRHGVNFNSPAPASLELVSEALRGADYRTLAVTGGGYVHPHYNLSQGFDRFWYWTGIDPTTGGPVDGADHEFETVLDLAGGWVRESADEPFFLFLHTYDIHYRLRSREPYFSTYSEVPAPPNLRWSRVTPVEETGFRRDKYLVLRDSEGETRLPDEMGQVPSDIYDSRITHFDSRLPDFFALLDELGLSERTIVVLTSDHGELLGEHDLFGHLSLYDENLMVPLMIAAPGLVRPGGRIGDQVRSIDIVPTILDLVGVPGADEAEGASLRSLMVDGQDGVDRPAWSYAAASNFGISLRRENRAKLIFNNTAWSSVNTETEFYRLDVDPAEVNDLGDDPEAQSIRSELLERYVRQSNGIRMTLINPGNAPFGLDLEGSILQQVGVKSTDANCGDCVRLPARGRASVTIPGGGEFTLHLEEIERSTKPLTIEARGVPGSPAVRRIEIDIENDLDGGLVLVWSGEGWERRSGTEPPADTVGIVLTQIGSPIVRHGDDLEVDKELTERLRALGYLD